MFVKNNNKSAAAKLPANLYVVVEMKPDAAQGCYGQLQAARLFDLATQAAHLGVQTPPVIVEKIFTQRQDNGLLKRKRWKTEARHLGAAGAQINLIPACYC